MIRAILHADKNWGIGKNNSLMFSIPKDMKFFRETTLGKTVVMGGNTLRSFPAGKPLKNRTNIVLSRGQVMDDCLVVSDLYVIGGASVYAALLPYCGEALVTKVEADGGADTFFPDLDKDENFVCVDAGEPVEDNGYILRFTRYQNLAVKPL